jgi:hypothetical protein
MAKEAPAGAFLASLAGSIHRKNTAVIGCDPEISKCVRYWAQTRAQKRCANLRDACGQCQAGTQRDVRRNGNKRQRAGSSQTAAHSPEICRAHKVQFVHSELHEPKH